MRADVLIPMVLLAGYLSIIGILLPSRLHHARWPLEHPRLAIRAWLAAMTGTTAAILLLGIGLATPLVAAVGGPTELWHACRYTVEVALAHPAPLALAALGIGAVGFLGFRAAMSGLAIFVSSARYRRAHLAEVRLVASSSRLAPHIDALVVPFDQPVAYCLSRGGLVRRRRGHIVLSTGAVGQLDDAELNAVVAHERAHVTGRHHTVLAAARALGTIPLPVFRRAPNAIATLAELAADDEAVRACGRQPLRQALLALGGVQQVRHAHALHAALDAAAVRAERLADGRPIALTHFRGTLPAVAAVALTPAAVVLVPAVRLATLHFCPLP